MASNSNDETKFKRVVLSIEAKLNICDMGCKKITKTKIMLKYNKGKSTITDISKSEESLKNFKQTMWEIFKSMKNGILDKVDGVSYLWFQQQEKGFLVIGPILLEKESWFCTFHKNKLNKNLKHL